MRAPERRGLAEEVKIKAGKAAPGEGRTRTPRAGAWGRTRTPRAGAWGQGSDSDPAGRGLRSDSDLTRTPRAGAWGDGGARSPPLTSGRWKVSPSAPGDGPDLQWDQWQPWLCMCDIGKQGRIRYFVVSSDAAKSNVSLDEFWQDKPCSLADCGNCQTTECPIPQVEARAASRFGRRFSRPAAGTLRIPDFKPSEANSYDSLPVVDDVG
ncbi:uncharacterized protein [Heptranchias perlo]|uniref:uncharacterized protein n=1 Tax=Heptranchias perlo TaxID=212740 RepID=UPI003559648F